MTRRYKVIFFNLWMAHLLDDRRNFFAVTEALRKVDE